MDITGVIHTGLGFGALFLAATSVAVLVLGAVVIRSRPPLAMRSLSHPRAPAT